MKMMAATELLMMAFHSQALLLTASESQASREAAAPVLLELDGQNTGVGGTLPVWSAKLRIGSNPEPKLLLVDTGSSVLVVTSAADVLGGRISGSSSMLATDERAEGGEGGEVTIQYAGGAVSGSVAKQHVCFAGTESGADGPCMDGFPVFTATSTDSAFSQLGLDGVLGLAPQPGKARYNNDLLDETVADGLAASANFARSFGLFVSPNADLFGESELALGGLNLRKVASGEEMQYVELAQPLSGRWELGLSDLTLLPPNGQAVPLKPCANHTGDCRVLIDSGTAGLEAHPSLEQLWQSSMPEQLADDCSNIRQMPQLQVTFQGGASLTMSSSGYLRGGDMGCGFNVDAMTDAELARHPSTVLVLGEPFLRHFYAAFDQDNARIGFAQSIAAPRPSSPAAQQPTSPPALAGFLTSA